MNWINKLLRKPVAKTAPPSSTKGQAAPPPPDNPATLRQALGTAVNDDERRVAAAALGRALAASRQAPCVDDPQSAWVVAVCHVSDKALALSWLAGVADDQWLAEVAAKARFSEVRLAALLRVEMSATLERIAELCRSKDKSVYRHCMERLRQRRRANDDGRRAEALAAEFHRLLEGVPVNLSRMIELEKELAALDTAVQAIAECRTLLDQAHVRVTQESAAQRELQATLVSAKQLLDACASRSGTEVTELDDWLGRRDAIAETRGRLPGWLAAEVAWRSLESLLHDIDGRLAALVTQRDEENRILACEQFLATMAATPPTDEESRDRLGAEWAALRQPENPDIRKSLEIRRLALQAPTPPAPAVTEVPGRPLERPVRIDETVVRSLLEKLEQAVEQGQLTEAEAAALALDGARGGHSLRGPLESRWQQAHAQLVTLRGWARWGAEEARESLIASAEQLLVGTPIVADLARDVKDLREKWKRLNAHGPTKKSQWQRFDAALETAYQPVAAHFAAEAARQAIAGAAKAALCDEWDSQIAAIDWTQADYKVAEAQREEMLHRWRSTEPASFQDERTLRKRFDRLLKGIERRLDDLRTAEIQRREQLIVEAEALGEEADLGRAIAAAKDLQDRWTRQAVAVRLDRRDEQGLWLRFRTACTAVFARRDAQRDQQAARRDERLKAMQALLDELSGTLAGADANAIKRVLGRFRRDWENTRADARDLPDGLASRARDAQQQALRRIDELLREKHGAHLALLARKAALAESVEAAAVASLPTDDVIATTRKAWDDLPRLPGKMEAPLAERLDRAPAVTAEGWALGHESRTAMLLDIEITLGLPSPDALADARRKRQLEHLKNRFGGDARPSMEGEALMVRWYATAAPSDPALEQRILAVKNKLLDQAIKNDG